MSVGKADGSNGLDANEIAALGVVVEKMRSDQSLVLSGELEFFKDYLTSLGWTADVKSTKKNGSENGKASGEKAAQQVLEGGAVTVDAAKPADTAGQPAMLSDSEDEKAANKRPKECTFGADLESELRRERNVSLEDEENDSERLQRETESFPLLPADENLELSAAAKKVSERTKQEAQNALEQGNLKQALEKYTKVIRNGGATALILAMRGQLLLKMRRPLAAVRDCSVALKLNSNLIKAYRIRGTCHRKLGHWRRAHRDLSQGQKLDWDDDIAKIHNFVASKLGLVQDPSTKAWRKKDSGQKVNDDTAGSQELKAGQAVRIDGLRQAPHLNGRRGVVQKKDSANPDRWEVELRLDDGRLEVKSIKAGNIILLRVDEKQDWKDLERKHAEDRRKREAQELIKKEEEARIARRKAVEKRLKQDGIPDMDPSELVEAEMSGMQLPEPLCKMIRKLEPDQALELLWQVQASRVNDMPSLLREKVREILGDEEDEDEEDTERLEEESIPLPPLPDDLDAEPENDEDQYTINMAKQAASDAQEAGNMGMALAKFTEAIELGGASALTLAKRAEVLLAQKRPCAAIRDCTAALEVNPDCGKAFRIRGVAHRRLGHWREALGDLAQGQALDFDEATTAVQNFVASKAKALENREARRKGVKRARLG